MRYHSLIAAAATAAAIAAAPAASAETVKVGVVLTFSGIGANLGQQIDRGMMLYQKLHPEAFGGHKVELIKRDSKNPAGDVAKTMAQELVTRERVQMLAGFIYSPDAAATAPIATQGKVPMIIMNAATAWLTNLSPYITRVSFSMWHAGYAMGNYAAEKLGCKTAVVAYTDYPPGKDSLDAFKTAYEAKGGKFLEGVPIGGPAQVPDFTPFLRRIMDMKPNCMYVFVPAGNHIIGFVKTYNDLGMRQAGIKMIGPGEITPDNELTKLGDGAVGNISMFHYSSYYDTPANRAFVAAWQKEYGTDSRPDFMGVAGWDGMAAIAHVVKTLNGKIDADKAVAALKGWKFDSPRGPIMIDPETRDIVQNEHVHEVVKAGNTVALKVIDSIPNVKDPCKALKFGRCGQ